MEPVTTEADPIVMLKEIYAAHRDVDTYTRAHEAAKAKMKVTKENLDDAHRSLSFLIDEQLNGAGPLFQ